MAAPHRPLHRFASRGRVPPLRPPVVLVFPGVTPPFRQHGGVNLAPAEPPRLADPRLPLPTLEVDGIRPRGAAQLGHHPLAQLHGERFPRLYPLPDREARRVDNIPIHGMTRLQLGGLGA
jgi:hypothetical protein